MSVEVEMVLLIAGATVDAVVVQICGGCMRSSDAFHDRSVPFFGHVFFCDYRINKLLD